MIQRVLGVTVGLFLLWQGFIWLFHIPPFLLPSPEAVFSIFKEEPFLLLGQFWRTLIETLVGFLLAAVWGAFMAVLIRVFTGLRLWMLPILLLSQAIPTFAVAPLFVIWFGYGMSSKIAVTIFALFFPITVAFYDGLRRTPREFLNLAAVMKSSRARQLYWIEIPAALPGLASGLRIAAAWAPMAAVIGEWVGSSSGLGFLILNANARADTALMFAALLVLIAFAMGLYFGVDALLKRGINWES